MNSLQVISNYELLSVLTAQMHDAAEQAAWDRLIAIEVQRTQLLATIKSTDAVTVIDEATRQRKRQLIEKILAVDAQTRIHAQACMDQLQLNIESNHNEQRLRQAYGV